MALNDIKVPRENAQGTFDEVALSAADISAVPTSRTVSAGTGLTGGGDLTANRTLSVSYGSSAGTACEGNDTRLSDARTPSSTLAHKASHATGGTDALAPSDIGAQSIFVTEDLGTITSNVTLTAARAKIYTVNTVTSGLRILLPTTNVMAGDVVIIEFVSYTGQTLTPVRGTMTGFFTDNLRYSDRATFVAASSSGTSWYEDRNISRFAAEAIFSGTLSIDRIPTGTGSTQVALGNHTHTLDDLSNVTAPTPSNNDVLKYDTSTSSWVAAAPAAAGVTSVSGTAPIVSSGGSTPTISISDATTSASGAMSSADKTKLDGIASGATANATDAQLRDRATHTGTQAATTITGLATIATSGSASDLSTGTVPTARLGTGTANGSTFLAGDQTYKAVSGVTTGSVDNAIIRADGTGGATSQGSDIVIDDAATATANNVAITNQHSGQTNSSLVLTPKGTGAFIVGPKPDGTTTGGNSRGQFAVDLQVGRSGFNAQGVASGNYSFVAGVGNRATSTYSASIGYANFAQTGQSAMAFGENNIGSGLAALAVNHTATASGSYSLSGGFRSIADRYGLQAFAAGQFAAQGDAQRIRAVLRCKTTTNAAVEMALDGSTTYLTIPSGKVIYGEFYIVGTKSDGSAVALYRAVYCAKNVAGTSTEVFSSVTTDNAAGTTLTITTVDQAGAATDYISIKPVGVASETWRWVAKADLVEISYGT